MSFKTFLFIAIFITNLHVLSGQENNVINIKGNLENQFDEVFKKSKNIDYGKLVSINNYNELKKNSLDSIKKLKSNNLILSDKIADLTEEKQLLEAKMSEILLENTKLSTSKTHYSVFGILINKSIFNITIVVVFAVIVLLLLIFIMKFKKANNNANIAIMNLSKVEDEYIDFKRRSMEKEQLLGRKLQDEINKNKQNID